MPSTRTRSRKFAEAFEEEEEEMQVDPNIDDVEEESEEALLEKEKDIWESIAEQHYEAIEQLPLSLQRQFTLLRELDEQTNGYSGALQRTIREYAAKRMAIKASSTSAKEQLPSIFAAVHTNGTTTPMDSQLPIEPPKTPQPLHHKPFADITPIPLRLSLTGTQTPLHRSHSDLAPQTPTTPIAIPAERMKQPETTREMLSHMGWLMDEWMKASNEKASLAQSAHDSIERQIRLLDQAIKEQEVAISISAQSGAQQTPLGVPETIVPPSRWYRPVARATLSPVLDTFDAPTDGPSTTVPDDGLQPTVVIPRRSKKKGSSRRSKPAEREGQIKPLTIRLIPPSVPVIEEPEVYCYCQTNTDGEMIECSGSQQGIQCPCNEWVHMECLSKEEKEEADDTMAVGQEGEPWYCKGCKQALGLS